MRKSWPRADLDTEVYPLAFYSVLFFGFPTTNIGHDLLRKSIEDLYSLSGKHGTIKDNKDPLSRVSY